MSYVGILDNFLRNLNVGCCDGYRLPRETKCMPARTPRVRRVKHQYRVFVEAANSPSLKSYVGILDNFLRNLNIGCCDGYRLPRGTKCMPARTPRVWRVTLH